MSPQSALCHVLLPQPACQISIPFAAHSAGRAYPQSAILAVAESHCISCTFLIEGMHASDPTAAQARIPMQAAIIVFNLISLKDLKSDRVARRVNAVGAAYILCRQ